MEINFNERDATLVRIPLTGVQQDRLLNCTEVKCNTKMNVSLTGWLPINLYYIIVYYVLLFIVYIMSYTIFHVTLYLNHILHYILYI